MPGEEVPFAKPPFKIDDTNNDISRLISLIISKQHADDDRNLRDAPKQEANVVKIILDICSLPAVQSYAVYCLCIVGIGIGAYSLRSTRSAVPKEASKLKTNPEPKVPTNVFNFIAVGNVLENWGWT